MGLFKSWMKDTTTEDDFEEKVAESNSTENDSQNTDDGIKYRCNVYCNFTDLVEDCDCRGFDFGLPKSIASAALLLSDLVEGLDDPRVDEFYKLFVDGMAIRGYAIEWELL